MRIKRALLIFALLALPACGDSGGRLSQKQGGSEPSSSAVRPEAAASKAPEAVVHSMVDMGAAQTMSRSIKRQARKRPPRH